MPVAPDLSAPATGPASQPAGSAVKAAGSAVGEAGAAAATQTAAWIGALPGWPDQADLLRICSKTHPIVAASLVLAGIIYLLFGYSIFRLLVTLNLAGLGAWGGWLVGEQFGAPMPGLIVGGVLLAAVAWPLVRYTVAFCGAVVGFVVGVTVWRACGLADLYAAAGGAIGAVFLCMLTFIGFKATIIAFTCIQGAVVLIGGALAMLMQIESVRSALTDRLLATPVFLPITLFALSVAGILFQQNWNKSSKP